MARQHRTAQLPTASPGHLVWRIALHEAPGRAELLARDIIPQATKHGYLFPRPCGWTRCGPWLSEQGAGANRPGRASCGTEPRQMAAQPRCRQLRSPWTVHRGDRQALKDGAAAQSRPGQQDALHQDEHHRRASRQTQAQPSTLLTSAEGKTGEERDSFVAPSLSCSGNGGPIL